MARLVVLAALVAAARPAGPACAAQCACRRDLLACSGLPYHRFPDTEAGVRHVSLAGAALGALGEAALDARALRTLVLVGAQLSHLEPAALASMVSTLASLDLGFNEFTEVPLHSLRDLKVLNWLNLQNNYISDLGPHLNWGFLADSLSSLSLSNNQLCALGAGALASLRALAQLDLDGNRLHALAPSALPPALAVLRLADNLLQQMPCAAAARLPRLRHLHLRNNMLRPTQCRTEHSKIDSLDLSHNELDDLFELDFQQRLQLKQLILDFNEFTSVPSFVMDSSRLEKLSIAYNKVGHVSEAAVHALRRRLERLDLDHNELSELPPSVVHLSRLRHLSLAYNRLQEVAALPPHLHSISLAGNFLTAFPKGLWSLAPAMLSYLDMGYNQIAVVKADMFGAWSEALSTLNLKGNRVAQLAGDAFPRGLPLRELMLSFTELSVVPGAALASLPALRALELSSSLLSGEFPLAGSSSSLSWLSLDNNNIHYVSSEHIHNFPSLEYLNLDFNKIIEFPSDVSGTNCSSRLKELRLSYNYISKISCDFFGKLTDLQSVDLSYNRVHNLSEDCFAQLHNLVYLNLVGNLLELVAERALTGLPKLQVLDLQDNRLTEFSTEHFENVSSEESNLSVNVSYNRIKTLAGGGRAVSINVLDLSHNLLESLSKAFFDCVGASLRQLLLANNHLTHIDNFAFGALSNLEIVILHHNNISAVKRRGFGEESALQILDLSHNRLAQLAAEQFHSLRRLRHLRLAGNELRALPRDVFKNTVLEHLDLARNQLAVFPGSALAQVGFTLRRLELGHNRLEYLDAAMFHATAFLHELGVAHNALTVLSDNTFAGLARLRRLDLSYNMIKTNFKELFHNLPRLRRLALAGAGLKAVPHLPLVNLTELDLSGNNIASYRATDMRWLGNLRVLQLSRNRFTSLQAAMWAAVPRLTSLDISHNPIVRIASGSFEGLNHLLQLRADHLRQLGAIEPRAFRPLVSLRSLTLESLALNGRTQVALADIAACVPGLENLDVHVLDPVLESQLSGLQAPKLRALRLRGAALRQVSARALAPLGRQRALALRLAGTSVRALPPALLRPLARVPHLALDLSDNQLVSFEPATLYPNLTGWNRVATKLLSGGLAVGGNPLRCGCSVSWVGAWLRRWTAEVGGWSAAAREAARRSRCAGGAVLLALHADEAACQASALSSRARCSRPRAALLCALLLLALS
ncbi:protein artichoke [Helicoverpa armigera]|uniref:protein artichoke n=1 Tax=Helicoverpa armigera TaxID=29058 RepID=UPI0030831D6D